MPTPETEPARPQPLRSPDGTTGLAPNAEPGATPQPALASADRKRQPSGDEARGRAMRAAISAIAEKGPAAVRMSDIAARAGMSTGHILYHFGKKDRLLLEVLAWSEADLLARFQQAADQAASPSEKLALFVRFYLPRHQGDERYALWTHVLAQHHDDAGRQLLTALSDAWEERLEAILLEGRALGRFADVDPTEFVIRAVAMLNGLSGDVMFGRPRWQHASADAFALSALERELRPTGEV
ncbi:TetR/AcrR family transcriptional regulator [Kitasatospora xanthocidica]|uniref:TetR/AcrR family transcriptional regulator n=1 Tax=Kitasatospora xanthocidica TaxID=83382 RepID=UPI001677B879|nr:TetR/AcrR family transcriptional regulator [Kitasatospora xanthocidica]